ncbi:ATPase family AAA domain-containing protein 5b [Centroberyx affinis]|uniref:ATPase family AAA domain-containing protein 5b n=1 Tax=Centroberyx affinis TaxID=166261 RepID=UPI003A5C62FD
MESFAVRNKLKRSKTCKVRACPSKDRALTDVIVLPESSCSDFSALLVVEEDTEEDTDGSDAAAFITTRKDQPLWEERSCYTPDIKIAPIFLRTTQHSRGKGALGQSLKKQTLLQKSVTTPQSNGLQLGESQQRLPPLTCSVSHLAERKESVLSSWRGQLSASARLSCLQEIRASHPAFPVRRVFCTLQKKGGGSLEESESSEKPSCLSSLQLPHNHQEKRKRGSEIDSSDKVSKRQRSNLAAAEVKTSYSGDCHLSAQGVQGNTAPPAKRQPRGSRLSRTHRLKQQRESDHELKSKPTSRTESDSQSLLSSHSVQRDSSIEDELWTEKYSPQHSSEVIGNAASVNKLHSWLKKWKLRADCDERRKEEERKHEENSNNSWDCGDFQGEAGSEEEREEPPLNTMLITGPTGAGKTASVYACAQELGFKVFEVNCSSQRSGRHLLSQLKEATQSHLVETSGKDPLKPAYFNNYNTSSCSPKPATLSGKTASPVNVISTSKKRPRQKLGHKGKPNPATVTLASFFKMKAKADNLLSGGLSSSEKPDSEKLSNPSSPGCGGTVSQSKKTATSLILFEEVDVIFDDDVGFLAAIKTFMATTKRPVILTTNDPSFRERFDGNLVEIIFKTPSAVNVRSYLQLVCLAEDVRLELDDVTSLLRLSRGDVRCCLLQLQLWAHSGGRRASQRGVLPKEPSSVHWSNVTEGEDSSDSYIPCTASMLGLHTVTQHNLLNLLKCESWTEPDMNKLVNFLSESWRRAVPLLYCNLELLLPLPIKAQGTPSLCPDEVTCSGLQSEPAPPDIHPRIHQPDGDVNVKAAATNSISVRNFSRLSRRKYATSNLTLKPHRTSLSLKGTNLRAPSSNNKTEPNAANLATRCLDALTDFMDLMSYLDATTPAAEPLVSERFVWTGAEIKDGLLDETREGEDGSCGQERLQEIQAAAEGLGFHRCWWRVSEVWTEAQRRRQELGEQRWGRLMERLTLPVSSQRQRLSCSFDPLCVPDVAQRRFELSRTVLSSRSFSLLGNRQAVSVDYMPVLRFICRSDRAQQQGKEPIRFLNYLSSVHLGLSKSTLQLLAEDFS